MRHFDLQIFGSPISSSIDAIGPSSGSLDQKRITYRCVGSIAE